MQVFTPTSLIAMLVQQLVYPFSYLYSFTAATCWLDLYERFTVIGMFTLGKKCALDEEPQVKRALERALDGIQVGSLPC